MRKYISICLLAIVALVFGALEAAAQSSQRSGANGRSETFFVEAMGPGLFVTANYDTRFIAGNPAGWGGRVGIGYFAVSGVSIVTAPIQVNYLLGGNKGNYFEIGGGATFASARVGLLDNDEDSTGSNVAGTLSFGYRLQPVESGFNFRAGLSPVFGSGYFVPYLPHISLGYTF